MVQKVHFLGSKLCHQVLLNSSYVLYLTCMRCEGTVTTATDNEDLSKARSP